MLDLFKQVHHKLNRGFPYFILFLLLPFIVLALEDCPGKVVNQDDVPCLLLLPFNQTPLQCEDYSVSVYNQSNLIYSQQMDNYSPFKCNATFNQTALGTYVHQYSNGDTGTILVEEGFRMILLLYFGIILTILLLAFGFWKEDITFLSLGGIFMMVIGVFIIINGFNLLDNLLTQAIGMILLGLGAYIIIRANIENLD